MTTKQATHTPGPWRVYEDQRGDNTLIVDRAGDLIATTTYSPMGIETDVVNARLIAEAPEMFEELEAIMALGKAILSMTYEQTMNAKSMLPWRSLVERIQDSIAKVKGEPR